MQQQARKQQDNISVPSGTGIQCMEYSQAGANTARIPPCRQRVTGY